MTGSSPPSNNPMGPSWASTANPFNAFMNTAKQINGPAPASGGKRRKAKKGSKKRTKKASKKTKRKSRRHRKKKSSSGFDIF